MWRALTDSKLPAQWLMANDMVAVVGHTFTFREKPQGDRDGIVHCEVLEVDAPRRLVYRWKGGNGQGRSGVSTTGYGGDMDARGYGCRGTLLHEGL